MLDYAALAVVAAVIREGSFERAAQLLNISPSAVSQRVRAIEERLGTVLIVRGQPCRATEPGQALCAHIDRVRLLEADLTPQMAAWGMQDAQPVTLRIAVNSDSLASWFPAALTAFARGTGMLVELVLDDEAHTADRLRSGEVVAAVTSDPAPVQGCRTAPLGALRYLACASPAFMAAHFPAGVNRDALARAPHLRFDRRDGLQARWAHAALGAVLGDGPAHTIPSTVGFIDMGLRGLGWAVHPETLIRPHLEAGRMVELLPGHPHDVALYWTVARLHAQPVRRLSDAVFQAARAALVS
jgi:LysR family transcriptional regulator, chromosome initiation inhibitor